MSERYGSSHCLSYMIENYYKNHCQKRYNYFVEVYGGISELTKLTDGYTRGNDIVKHMLLHKFAKSAAETQELQSIYQDSLYDVIHIPYAVGTSIVYIPQGLYSLPNPEIVTSEESDALTYAFINFLKENMV